MLKIIEPRILTDRGEVSLAFKELNKTLKEEAKKLSKAGIDFPKTQSLFSIGNLLEEALNGKEENSDSKSKYYAAARQYLEDLNAFIDFLEMKYTDQFKTASILPAVDISENNQTTKVSVSGNLGDKQYDLAIELLRTIDLIYDSKELIKAKLTGGSYFREAGVVKAHRGTIDLSRSLLSAFS